MFAKLLCIILAQAATEGGNRYLSVICIIEEAMSETAAQVKDICIDLGRVNGPMSDEVIGQTALCAQVLLEQLACEAASFTQSAAGQPLLYQYQADATSFKCVAQVSMLAADHGGSITRSGRGLVEILSERAAVKTMDRFGCPKLLKLLPLPRSLQKGESAEHHLAAACEFRRKFWASRP